MTIRFRDHGKTLTLYVEKVYDDGWTVGFCPELEKTMCVHPANLLEVPHETVPA